MLANDIKQEYPFGSHYLDIKGNELHYVDEGEGEVMLMVHGNPTWSFFYRNLIKHFAKTHRVIAPDHIGCGLSSKPQDYDYRLSNHVNNLEKLVLDLDLKNITLIVHDWGGAIGMGLATKYPERIKQMIIMNTAAFASLEIPFRINILRNPIGEWFIRNFNGFAGPATFMAVEKPMSKVVKNGFIYPYKNFSTRIATAKFVRDIPMSENHPTYNTLKNIENNLKNISSPVLLLWGAKDFCFTLNFQKRWLDFFPKAKVKVLSNAGHYLIEDEQETVIDEISNFIKENEK